MNNKINNIAHLFPDLVKYATAKKLKHSLYEFTKMVFQIVDPSTLFIDNWHIHMLTDVLTACYRRELKRVLINIPPRSMKSIITSVAFPAWVLSQNPSEQIIVSSYSQMLATKHSMDCRSVLSSDGFVKMFPESAIAFGTNTKNRFGTISGGYRFATSVGGSITGDGGNFLVIDDPHNPSYIDRKNYRNRVINWFKTTLLSRINDKKSGVVIVVMQRLHENDLSGYLLKEQGDMWYHISIPMVAEKKTIIGFKNKEYITLAPGDVMHSSRDSVTEVDRLKSEIGSRVFSAQYQQKPWLESSNYILSNMIKYYDNVPDILDYSCISVDCAIGSKENNDYSVIAYIASKDGISYVLDIVRCKLEYSLLRDELINAIKIRSPNFVIIENRAHGSAMIQEISKIGLNNIITINPKINKVARFHALAVAIEAGHLLFPKKATFLDELIAEIVQFPNATHDDQVDALSQYLNWTRDDMFRSGEKMRVRMV